MAPTKNAADRQPLLTELQRIDVVVVDRFNDEVRTLLKQQFPHVRARRARWDQKFNRNVDTTVAHILALTWEAKRTIRNPDRNGHYLNQITRLHGTIEGLMWSLGLWTWSRIWDCGAP